MTENIWPIADINQIFVNDCLILKADVQMQRLNQRRGFLRPLDFLVGQRCPRKMRCQSFSPKTCAPIQSATYTATSCQPGSAITQCA